MSSTPELTPTQADVPAEDRVHHHARVDDDQTVDSGIIVTLCGLRMSGPRPGAAKMPCCPMCALSLPKPCK